MKYAQVTKTLQVRLYEIDYNRLQKEAEKNGITISEHVRRLILPKNGRNFPLRAKHD